MRRFEELPAELSAYIKFLEKHLDLPINFISSKSQNKHKKHFFFCNKKI